MSTLQQSVQDLFKLNDRLKPLLDIYLGDINSHTRFADLAFESQKTWNYPVHNSPSDFTEIDRLLADFEDMIQGMDEIIHYFEIHQGVNFQIPGFLEFFDKLTGKLRPLSDTVTIINAPLVKGDFLLEPSKVQKQIELQKALDDYNERAAIMRYIYTHKGKLPAPSEPQPLVTEQPVTVVHPKPHLPHYIAQRLSPSWDARQAQQQATFHQTATLTPQLAVRHDSVQPQKELWHLFTETSAVRHASLIKDIRPTLETEPRSKQDWSQFVRDRTVTLQKLNETNPSQLDSPMLMRHWLQLDKPIEPPRDKLDAALEFYQRVSVKPIDKQSYQMQLASTETETPATFTVTNGKVTADSNNPNEDMLALMVIEMAVLKRHSTNKSFKINDCENDPAMALKLYLLGHHQGLRPVLSASDQANIKSDPMLGRVWTQCQEILGQAQNRLQDLDGLIKLLTRGLGAGLEIAPVDEPTPGAPHTLKQGP